MSRVRDRFFDATVSYAGDGCSATRRRSGEAALPVWATRAPIVAGALMAFGGAWQISDGLTGQEQTRSVNVEADGRVPADATMALRSAIDDMHRELERARRLLEQTGAQP
jgi:hypothetical protein